MIDKALAYTLNPRMTNLNISSTTYFFVGIVARLYCCYPLADTTFPCTILCFGQDLNDFF